MDVEETPFEEIELVLEPIPPDTTDSIRDEFETVVRETLRSAGQEELLDSGQIQVQVEEAFPVDEAVTALISLGVGVTLKIFEATLLPEIQKRWKARVKSRKKRRKK